MSILRVTRYFCFVRNIFVSRQIIEQFCQTLNGEVRLLKAANTFPGYIINYFLKLVEIHKAICCCLEIVRYISFIRLAMAAIAPQKLSSLLLKIHISETVM